MKGIVKWYNARKGYGFITPDDKSDDVFVHATSLKTCGLKKLYTGSEVSFETDQDDKGKRVKSIKILKEAKPTEEKKSDNKKEVKKEEKDIKKKEQPKPEEKSKEKAKAKPKEKSKPKSKPKPKPKTETKKTKGSGKK